MENMTRIEIGSPSWVEKPIAKVKLLGNAFVINITEDMDYKLPTEEQIKNLKETFGIEVEICE